jgi:hypothetical protein
VSGSSHTGGYDGRKEKEEQWRDEATSPMKQHHRVQSSDPTVKRNDGSHVAGKAQANKPRTYIRRPRNSDHKPAEKNSNMQSPKTRKRGTKLAWVPVAKDDHGRGEREVKGQRTGSVFNRLENPSPTSADPAGRGRREQ